MWKSHSYVKITQPLTRVCFSHTRCVFFTCVTGLTALFNASFRYVLSPTAVAAAAAALADAVCRSRRIARLGRAAQGTPRRCCYARLHA